MHVFAMIGVAGFVAPRHLKAIRDTGSTLRAAFDVHDSVGILDSYFPDATFFTGYEPFERYLQNQALDSTTQPIEYVGICTPNYLHDTHIRLALHSGAHAICEKPLVIEPDNLRSLADLENKLGKRVYTVLQLRLHPSLLAVKQQLSQQTNPPRYDVILTYITSRGQWYHQSWKGDHQKSGGLAMNIGIHFFDLLIWLFGGVERSEVHLIQPDKMAGALELEGARVRWYLSIDRDDLPPETRQQGRSAFRSITMDGQEIEFTEGFTDLHTRVYEKTLAGAGFGIADALPSIQLVHQIRHADLTSSTQFVHPLLKVFP